MLVQSGGVPLGGVSIMAVVASNYDAGVFTVEALTSSLGDGTWREPLMLDELEYKIMFVRAGYESQVRTVTVGGA
jgi:hypothetical protein